MEILLSVLIWLISSQQNHFADMRIMAILPPASVETLGKVPEKSKTVVSKPAKPKAKQPAGKFASKKVVLEDWKVQIARKICAPGRKWDCKTALSVAYAESGLNPNAKSSTNDHGIFQLHGKPIYDVDANIDEAERMYEKRGWGPWVTHETGVNKKFLNLQTASGSIIQEGGGSE